MFPADAEMELLPNVRMSLYILLVQLGEKGPGGLDIGTVRDRLGGVGICSSTEGAGPMLESLISVLLFYTPPNMISQVGTPAELHLLPI